MSIEKHKAFAKSDTRELIKKWLFSFKWHYFLLFLSNYGNEIVKRKYDAVATDMAYEPKYGGKLGFIGKFIDYLVHQQDIHVGLRQRLEVIVNLLYRTIKELNKDEITIISAPCGLIKDLVSTSKKLKDEGYDIKRIKFIGLDLDSSGEVEIISKERASEVGINFEFIKANILDEVKMNEILQNKKPDIFLTIGFIVWIDENELSKYIDIIYRNLSPNAYLIIDNFHSHKASRMANDFEMKPFYHSEEFFEKLITSKGFKLLDKEITKNNVNVVYRFIK